MARQRHFLLGAVLAGALSLALTACASTGARTSSPAQPTATTTHAPHATLTPPAGWHIVSELSTKPQDLPLPVPTPDSPITATGDFSNSIDLTLSQPYRLQWVCSGHGTMTLTFGGGTSAGEQTVRTACDGASGTHQAGPFTRLAGMRETITVAGPIGISYEVQVLAQG